MLTHPRGYQDLFSLVINDPSTNKPTMYEYFDFIPYHIKNKSKRQLSVSKTVECAKFSKPQSLNTYLDHQLVAKNLKK